LPLVGKAVASRAWERGSPDHWLFLLLALFSLRAFTYQLWSSYSNMLFLTRRRRIVRDGVDFEQIDREWDWDNFLILHILMASAALYAFPSLRRLPGWDARGLAVAALLHVAATEPLFYLAHRALHGERLFARYHALHHSARVPTPFTAGFATPLEHAALGALLALPLAGACAAGVGSAGLAFVYVLGFDFLRAMGHCNVELFPAGLFRAVPLLRYLLYTPTYVHFSHWSLRGRALFDRLAS
jgi:sterol desaturase/sphingolipid hydroxylase (fatty acid hydroxylase superfamily)